MKTAARFAIPLLVIVAVTAWAMTPVVDHLMTGWFRSDVEMRSRLIFQSVQETVLTHMAEGRTRGLDSLFRRIAMDQRVLAVGLCGPRGRLVHASRAWPARVACPRGDPAGVVFTTAFDRGDPLLAATFPLVVKGRPAGYLVILNDLRFIAQRSARFDLYLGIGLALLGLAFAAVTILVARVTLRQWVRSMKDSLVTRTPLPGEQVAPEIAPLVRDLRKMMRDVNFLRGAADSIRIDWTAETLRRAVADELPGAEIMVLSNREPYIHNYQDGEVVMQRPASGLVTALEPIMRACGGVWIAHGSGSADHELVDAADHLKVPPDRPAYTLRRVWLSDEEQDGYYYGYANEGLWPLCHIAYVRPIFRATDWEFYVEVNRKFADAVVAEARTGDPLVLVQDYHFALAPRMIREHLPQATIITFWHIPWPNSEIFGICPHREEILAGLLGSSIIGFHTRFHCNNFLDTADRYLECQVDREHSTVSIGGTPALVRPYPISIEWPPSALVGQLPVEECRKTVRDRYHLPDTMRLAVGVERFDYTKGIPDRFHAVAALLESHPEWIGRFVLLQVAAPTRSRLPAYTALQTETAELAEQVNRRFGTEDWKPVILVPHHHEPHQVFELFRAADVAVVTSLHDGMNLVAKEFVAARDDEQGVLILSTFVGASRELLEALIVNPYDARAMGEALHTALMMPADLQRDRMMLMRESVRENNIYYWAGRMLFDAARMRKRSRIEERIVHAGMSKIK